ncbi:hypothetical protein ACS0TY_034854 [Phlomoides rotata]
MYLMTNLLKKIYSPNFPKLRALVDPRPNFPKSAPAAICLYSISRHSHLRACRHHRRTRSTVTTLSLSLPVALSLFPRHALPISLKLGGGVAEKVIKAGLRCIISNQDKWYLDHLDAFWQDFYSNEPLTNITNHKQQALILGGEEQNIWL